MNDQELPVTDLLAARRITDAGPDFWNDLEAQLATEPAPIGDSTTLAPAEDVDTEVDSAGTDLGELQRRRVRRWLIATAATAAALVAIIFGLNALSEDTGPAPVITDTTPSTTVEAVGTSTTTATTTVPEDSWTFEVELVEVEGLWSVAANATAAWGVPIAAPRSPLPDSDHLFKLDLATNTLVATVPIRGDAVFVAAADDAVWVSHADGWLSRIDPGTDSVVATIEIGGSPWWIDVGVDSVWVAVRGSGGEGGGVVRVDPLTNSVAGEIEIDSGTPTVVMEGAGGVWAWNLADNTAIRIDPSTESIAATVDLELPGFGFGVGSDSVWRAAVGRGEQGVVTRVDSQTNSIGAHIEIESPDGSPTRTTGVEVVAGSAWVSFEYGCEADGCLMGLARIDEKTSAVVATATLPSDSAIIVTVGPSTVWVAGDGQLARVDI
jgi:hypothetical protein